jgi:hypothetical protein
VAALAFSYQMTGALQKAHTVIYDALKQEASQSNTYHGRLLASLGFIQWMAADLSGLRQTAVQYLKLGQKLDLPETLSFANYLLGIALYHLNETTAAERCLMKGSHRDSVTNILNFAHSTFALSLISQIHGQPDKACTIAESVVNHALETHNPSLLQLAQAFQAELAFRQGRIAEASSWAKHFDPFPFHAAYRFYVPQLTMSKVLIALGTTDSHQQADDLLSHLHEFFVSIHNSRFLIEVLALQAILYDIRGDEATAHSRC